MTQQGKWKRVRKGQPCPICEREDWCLLSLDGSAAICARTESPKRCGEAGWLHKLRDDPWQVPVRRTRTVKLVSSPATSRTDFNQMAKDFQDAADGDEFQNFAVRLGLSIQSLCLLSVGWSATHSAWSFPMRDPEGNVLGIRLRRPDGSKLSVTGGREGLFLPCDMDVSQGETLLICEGATDAAALLDLEFANVVGRPSCSGGVRLLAALVTGQRPSEVVIVADLDEPGQRGADGLAAAIIAYVPQVKVIYPPAGVKDARAWLQAGATHQDIIEAIARATARKLRFRSFRR